MAQQQSGQPGEWTLYKADGKIAIPFDTFFSVAVSQENKVASQPVERGGFVDYNKTASPFTVKIKLGKTGPSPDLSAYLDAIDALVDGTELISVVTPGRTFTDVNALRYDYDRTTDTGVDRLIVELTVQEIKQVSPQYSNASLPQSKVRRPQDASGSERGKQQGKEGGASVLTQLRKAATS